MRRLLAGLILLCALLAPPVAAQSVVDTVDVTPALDTILIRQSTTLTSRHVDSTGLPLNKVSTWKVRDTSALKPISTVRPSTGISVVTLWAKGDTGRSYVVDSSHSGTNKKDSSLVIVRDTVCSHTILGSVDVRPDSGVIRHRDTVGVIALPRSQCGGLMQGGVNITWASTATGDATVSSLDSLIGRVIGVDSTGTVYIRGTSGTETDSAKFYMRGDPAD